jgi:hypothetical protein
MPNRKVYISNMNWRNYIMPDDINELDVTDAGLKGIFGDRFHDETQPAMARPKKISTTCKYSNVAEKATEKPVEAQWEPVKENTWLDNLKACAFWSIGFGCLTLLLFCWQQEGLMDASIAIPSMWVSTALGGWGVGRNAVRRNR